MNRILLATSLSLALACACFALPCAAAQLPAAAAQRLDPRLSAAVIPGAEPVPVWVEFTDKGEGGPSDVASLLAQAERELSPESRHRRERVGVSPLVDWLDVPLHAPYVDALKAAGLAPYGQSRWFNRVAVRTSGDALVRLAQMPFVHRLAPVELAMLRRDPVGLDSSLEPATPGAHETGLQATQASYGLTRTQLQRLNMIAVHDSGYIGTGVLVCVLDEGFNYYRKHIALRNLPIAAGRVRDFVGGDLNVQDTVTSPQFFRHGTWTLSTLGGNAPGFYLGPGFGASFALARTENSASETPQELVNWAMGAEWADSLGADIISSSLGYNLMDDPSQSITYPQLDGHTTVVTRAAEIAAAKGILVVNSAGNDGQNPSVGYKIAAPSDANGDSVLCVGAVDSLGVLAAFSSKGPTYDGRIKPDLVAQGRAVLMADAFGNANLFVRNNGTSFSCPLVAGMAACLIQAHPLWPPTLIARSLKATASQHSFPDTLKGWGIPDGLAALRWIPDTVGIPPGGPTLRLAFDGANPLRSDGAGIVLRFGLSASQAAGTGRVRAFDAGGRCVREVWSGALQPGVVYAAPWRGDDDQGRALSSGVYFLAFERGRERSTLRVAVLR